MDGLLFICCCVRKLSLDDYLGCRNGFLSIQMCSYILPDQDIYNSSSRERNYYRTRRQLRVTLKNKKNSICLQSNVANLI